MKKHMACRSALPSVAYVSQSRLRMKGAFVKMPDTRIWLICYMSYVTCSTWISRMEWIGLMTSYINK